MPIAAALAAVIPATFAAAEGRPTLRAARAADAAAMRDFIDALGADSRRWRFHGGLGRCSATRAQALVAGDDARQIVWLATVWRDGRECIVGEARAVRDAGGAEGAELAMVVADDWQGRGVAGALLRRLLDAARAAGVRQVRADVMAGNARMQAFLRRHGFGPGWHADAEGACFERALAAPGLRHHLADWLRRPAGGLAVAAADLRALGV